VHLARIQKHAAFLIAGKGVVLVRVPQTQQNFQEFLVHGVLVGFAEVAQAEVHHPAGVRGNSI